MRPVLIAIIVLSLFSCKKTNQLLPIPDLHSTNWNLHYKYDGFTFYAETELRFHADTTFENIGVSDTIYGHWNVEHDSVQLFFDNNAYFHGIAISTDSLSGTMFNAGAGIGGVWNAGTK